MNQQAGILEKVESELMAFSHTLDKSPNFAAYLANPTVPRGEKASMVITTLFICWIANLLCRLGWKRSRR